MTVSVCSIYFYGGKAFVPVSAQSESGLWVSVEPFQVVEVIESEIVKALEQARAAGHPRIPNPGSDYLDNNNPLLKVTGAKSFKQFDRKRIAYLIVWDNQEVYVNVAPVGEQNFDLRRRMKFDDTVSLSEIVQAILKDWEAHS